MAALDDDAKTADVAAHNAQVALAERSDELKYLRSRPDSRISFHLDQRRQQLADLCGIDDAHRDLPFVAELVDLLPDDEEWRTAAEAAIGNGVGRIILYDRAIKAKFVRHANNFPRGQRLVSEAVDLDTPAPRAVPDPTTLAGKVHYKDGSPFVGWLQGFIATRFPHQCVESTDALLIDDGRQRITIQGQTRRQNSGGHGAPLPHDYVLGFNNEQRIAELAEEVDTLAAAFQTATDTARELHRRRSVLIDQSRAWEVISHISWDNVDTTSSRTRVEQLRKEQQELLDSDDRITHLKEQRDAAREDLDEVGDDRHEARTRVKNLVDRITQIRPLAQRASATLETITAHGVIALTDGQRTLLNSLIGDVYTGDVDTVPAALGKVEHALTAQMAACHDEIANAKRGLEDLFRVFKSRWENYEWGTDASSYPDYYGLYRTLVDSGIAEHRDRFLAAVSEWTGIQLSALSTEFENQRRSIHDRLDNVNAILERIPFGRDNDRLRIDPTDRYTPTSRHFWDSVQQFIESTSGAKDLDLDTAKARYDTITKFIRQITPSDMLDRGEQSQRDDILDVRRHVTIKAQKIDPDTKEIKGTYAEFDAKSGGEMQEMVAFIVGAALRYQLGDEHHSRPTFAPIILDEAFIKADSQFASRAVQAWISLGFQLIAGSVVDKVSAISRKVDRVVLISKDNDGYSSASPFIGDKPIPT